MGYINFYIIYLTQTQRKRLHRNIRLYFTKTFVKVLVSNKFNGLFLILISTLSRIKLNLYSTTLIETCTVRLIKNFRT